MATPRCGQAPRLLGAYADPWGGGGEGMRLPRDMAMPPVLAVGSRLTVDLGLAAAPSMRKGGRGGMLQCLNGRA